MMPRNAERRPLVTDGAQKEFRGSTPMVARTAVPRIAGCVEADVRRAEDHETALFLAVAGTPAGTRVRIRVGDRVPRPFSRSVAYLLHVGSIEFDAADGWTLAGWQEALNRAFADLAAVDAAEDARSPRGWADGYRRR